MKNDTSFNLIRWFSVLSLVSITVVAVVAALLLSRFLTGRMLHQDAVVSMQFVQSLAQVENAGAYFVGHENPGYRNQLEDFFRHVATMPDVIRANVYSVNRTVLWSSDPNLIGRHFTDNPELDESLAGDVTVESGIVGREKKPKQEHVELSNRPIYFAEYYLPIRDSAHGAVLGVVELYKTPHNLFEAIHAGQRLIWIAAAAAGLILYLALFWVVRRADATIRMQQQRLVETETLAAIGEMASAVAHGIRNPLASIRTAAEMVDEGSMGVKEASVDIIEETDRLDSWIRDLLQYARPAEEGGKTARLEEVIRASAGDYARELERRSIQLTLDLAAEAPGVRGDPALLRQVFNSLFANAVEATEKGGQIIVVQRLAADGRSVHVKMSDTGHGIDGDQLRLVFKPFFTTKPKGLGIGLPLIRRIIERYGGQIALDSQPGSGTTVSIQFSVAR